MSKDDHKHNYVAEKYTVQEHVNKYQSNGKYTTAILEVDKAYIFCTVCGDIRMIEVLKGQQDV